MKYVFSQMKKLIFITLLLLLSLTVCSLPNYSQHLCHVINLETNRVKGRVLSQGKTEKPIRQTKVELIRFDERLSFVSSVLTDDTGYFEIKNIRNGGYFLIAWHTNDEEASDKYYVGLQVMKTNDTKSKNLIQIKLGLDCSTSEAKLIK
jgi:hypothetical protein